MKFDEILNITDFTLAATLVTVGFNNYKLDKTNPRRIIFSFKSSKDLEKTVDDFWQKKLLIEPQNFSATTKMLRAHMFS